MKKISITIFLSAFTAFVMFPSSRVFAQKSLPQWRDSLGEVLIQLDSGLFALKRGDLDLKGLHFDSTLKGLRKLQGSKTPLSRHYFSKNDKRYYIENVPPTLKGKRIDDSNVWLLNDDVVQAWH
jgi:hypothetical protein